MNINHRLTASPKSDFYRAVKGLGIQFEDSEYTSVLNITEDNDKWPRLKQLIYEFNVKSMLNNNYTKKEIMEAEWLEIGTTGHFGYPQPEDNYEELTYNLSNACNTCGIGKDQKAPFRLRNEPKATRSHFLQLNWVFDEFFIRPEVKDVFIKNNIKGINYLNPVINKSSQPISSISQINIINIQSPCLFIDQLETVTCKMNNEETNSEVGVFGSKRESFCNRIKYHVMHRGPLKFSRDQFITDNDFIKSNEWFGSGALAFRLVIISRKVADLIILNKWRGISLEPIVLTN